MDLGSLWSRRGAAEPDAPRPPTPEASLSHHALAVLVDKSDQTVRVLKSGEVVSEYRATVGRRGGGDKLYEGDMRTPEGLYRIVGKRPHDRWAYFLDIDYPNESDRERYRQNVESGRIPAIGNRTLGIGGSIGLHGSDRPDAQGAGTNWTKGCVALTNADIRRLHDALPIGTPVLIIP